MKLGLDVHGVIDTDPDIFVDMAMDVRLSGGEVHIITGTSLRDGKLRDELLDWNSGIYWWDYLISINDALLKTEKSWTIDKHGRPNFPADKWFRFKGNYCYENNIDLMIDDTEEYHPWFNTPFFLYKR